MIGGSMKKLIFIAVLISFTTVAYSDNPFPGPLKGTRHEKEQFENKNTASHQEQLGTEKFPIFVKGVAGPKSKEEADYEAYIHHRKPFYELLSVIISVVIAGITGILAFYNVRLWRSTKIAAEAAKKSADSLPAIERAYLFVNLNEPIDIFFSKSGEEPPSRAFRITINMVNEGKTPAIVTKIYAGIIITREQPTRENTAHIMKEIPFSEMRGGIVDKREIRSGERSFARVEINDIDDSDFLEVLNMALKADPPSLFCCGKVIYKDIMKNERMTWFCWEYNRNKSFLRADNEEMNDYT
jgi:hypothetical protein